MADFGDPKMVVHNVMMLQNSLTSGKSYYDINFYCIDPKGKKFYCMIHGDFVFNEKNEIILSFQFLKGVQFY